MSGGSWEERLGTRDALFSLYGMAVRLMAEDGCPWDRAQSVRSMRQYLVEETFEAVDAITEGDALHAREELGDVLYNALFMAYLYEREGAFSVEDMARSMHGKMVRRHPHVFGKDSGRLRSEEEVNRQWESIKRGAEGRKRDSVLDEVPGSFPPLLKAFKYLKKAASNGFDWPTVQDALAKVSEETREVAEAVGQGNEAAVEEELGDLLLSVVNVCRKCGISPDVALQGALAKFRKRYTHVEQGNPSGPDDMMRLWDEAKRHEH